VAAGRVADSFGGYRERLVETLRAAGVDDLAVLRAFAETPRHLFVPEALRNRAYDDVALPIGFGQTISQPTTQALALQALALTGTERVLEIGTGSGYQAALLSRLASRVISVERNRDLAGLARGSLESAGVRDVLVIVGDGSLGFSSEAPYDAIVVAAVGPEAPRPLVEQLAQGGRLVLPIQEGREQVLVRGVRNRDGVAWERLAAVRFVPLIGEHGFDDRDRPKE
jgi:protein-L-isoaspartate(D-aspartate) O-methyltransferase